MARLDDFVERLARVEAPADVFNQYSYREPANAIRRENLRRYLGVMAEQEPDMMLVGEAAGYRGCRLTGLPFTSEHLLLEAKGGGALGRALYGKSAETARPVREATATILWSVLDEYGLRPLLWNAFPLHPYRPGNPWSNRRPRAGEIRLGQPFLVELLALFPIGQVVAVGNAASGSLSRLDITHHKARHPSQGGKAAFRRAMEAIQETAKRPTASR
jgi:uracil-DNA glycosylase